MASVNTNAAAITALRTLQQTNASLDKTQDRISTGYKIGQAKDNAAYWAISTTLKSDNKSLSTVKDALNLGSSTVDTAYQGLNKAKDVLDEIKSKLTAATQDGVNRDTIQDEIGQLQDQLKSIATSSVFSGENWLSVDTSAVGFNPEKQVVSSFSRDANGSVSIGTIKVETSDVALFDNSTVAGSGGILDKATSLKDSSGRNLTVGGTLATTGNTNTGGVQNAAVVGGLDAGSTVTPTGGVGSTTVASAAAAGGAKGALRSDTVSFTGINTGDKMTFSFQDNGGAVQTVQITKTAGMTAATDLSNALNTALTAIGSSVTTAVNSSGKIDFASSSATTGSVFTLNDIVVTDGAGHAKNGTAVLGLGSNFKADVVGGSTWGAAATNFVASTAGTYADNSLAFTGINATDTITLNMTINGQAFTTTVAAGNNQTAFVANLNANSTFASYGTASWASSTLTITSGTTGTASTVAMNSVVIKDSTGAVRTGLTASGTGFEKVGQVATTDTNTFVPVTLDDDDTIMFNVQVNDATAPKTITIDKALVSKTLGTTDGKISLITDYQKVMAAALTAGGISGVSTTVNGAGTALTLATTTAGGPTAKITISNAVASNGGAQISVDKIDISSTGLTGLTSDQVKSVLTAYIDVVNTAITKVTSAAASLGSVASRIDSQKSFVDTLMDTIDKGVGNLVDADMSEESTKLQALQVKQQLATQSLSIANQSAQNILSLFK